MAKPSSTQLRIGQKAQPTGLFVAPASEPLPLRLKRLHEEIAAEQNYRQGLSEIRAKQSEVPTKAMPESIRMIKNKQHTVFIDGEKATLDDLDLRFADVSLIRGPRLYGDGYSHVPIFSCECANDMENGSRKMLACDGEVHQEYRKGISGKFHWIPYRVCPIKVREIAVGRQSVAA